MASHLSYETLDLMINGQLDPASAAQAQEHVGTCSACRARYDECKANERLLADLVSAVRNRPVGSRPEPGRAAGGDAGDDSAGQVISGYHLLAEIHRGGQGVVYKAVQEATRRTVAVKVLLHGILATDRQRHYFEREVELVATLHHPNIVTLYESGITQDRYYFAMEYIEGQPLDRYVRSLRLSSRDVVVLFAKVCGAVAHAHQHGIIHRDLKPSNVLVDAFGEPHVLDFGLAKPTSRNDSEQDEHQTAVTGQIVGTPAYMSPEQAAGRSGEVDLRTDVYSLGVMLYELLTGQFPYDVRGSTFAVLKNIQEAEPVKPSKIIPRLDSDLQAIALKTLAKDPVERYQSAVELAHELDFWLQGLPIATRSTSSLYVLRKLMVRHRYTSTVATLLFMITLGFGLVGLDLYRKAGAAQEEVVRVSQSQLEARQDRNEIASLAMDERSDALRRNALAWILLAWHQGRTSEVRATSQSIPQDSRERVAADFLLDARPLDEKVDVFKDRLGSRDLGFAEFLIGEHHLKAGNPPEAVAAYRRCLRERCDAWIASRAEARLDAIVITSRPVAGLQGP